MAQQYQGGGSDNSLDGFFERERQRLGIKKGNNNDWDSFFEQERQRLNSGKKTMFEESREMKTQNERMMGEVQNREVKTDPNYNPFPKRDQPEEEPKQDPTTTNNEGRGGFLGFLDSTVGRFSKNATEVFFPGVIAENERRVREGETDNPILQEQFSKADNALEKGSDITGTIGGYVAPTGAAYRGVRLAGLGAKGAKSLGGKALQYGKEGAFVGAATGLGVEANQELQAPDQQTFGEHAKDVGMEAAFGAVGDPALMGLGNLGKRTFQKTMANINKPKKVTFEGVSDETLNKMQPKERPFIPNNQALEIEQAPNVLNKERPFKPNNGALADVQAPKADDYIMESQTTPQQANIPEIQTPKVETPQQSFKVDQPTPKPQNERSFMNTVKNSTKTTDELLGELEGKGKFKQLSNKEVVDRANMVLDQGIEEAVDFFKNGKLRPEERIVVGHRLVDEFQKQGNFQRASEIVEELAEQGTQAGRNVQLFSVYNRLTPEGLLVHAQRRVNNYNETVSKLGKKTKLTDDMAATLTDSAATVQAMTGQSKQANNVINLMEKAKQGNTLTDEELGTVRQFMQDARKFVGDVADTTPKKPKKITDNRKRDKVVDFMSKQEELAKKRIQQRRNAANALPLDLYYDYAVVGASKIAKGTVKMSDFTESMVKDFGEEIRPYMQQIYNKAVENFNLQSEGMTRKRLSEAEKLVNKALKDKTINEDEADAIRQAAQDLAKMTGDAKLEASMQIQATLQALERPTFGQKISTAQVIMQLFNPKTIVRNILGNELFYRAEEMSKFVSVPIDIVQSQITKGNRTVFFRSGNQGKYWENWMAGAKAGWKGLNPEGLQTQYDLGPPSFSSKKNPLFWLERGLGAALKSFDYAGYKRAYNKQVGQLAKARAYEEGYRGAELNEKAQEYITNVDENITNIADEYGRYATFQDNTTLSTGLQKTKRALNFNKDFGFGDLVLKYPKTPGNLIMRSLEYSPAGLIRSGRILSDAFLKGVPYRSEEFARSLARSITGTIGFSGLGLLLANKGVLTGPGDSDYETSALKRTAGEQDNSVNVTALKRFITGGMNPDLLDLQRDDLFVSFDWAQPVAMSVILGTAIDQSVKEEEGNLNPYKAAVTALTGATDAMVSMSVLRGLDEFLTTYPGEGQFGRFARAAQSLPSSFVPTLSNQVNQATNNQAPSTYDPNAFQKSINQAKRRVPGVAQTLPDSYTTLGEKRQTFQDNSNSLFNVFFNPAFVSRYNPSPEAKYILDFIKQTGDKTVAPRYAPKSITIDGEKYELNAEEYTELQRLMGMETQIRLKQELPDLQSMETEKAKKKLDSILREAGYAARAKLKEMRK